MSAALGRNVTRASMAAGGERHDVPSHPPSAPSARPCAHPYDILTADCTGGSSVGLLRSGALTDHSYRLIQRTPPPLDLHRRSLRAQGRRDCLLATRPSRDALPRL